MKVLPLAFDSFGVRSMATYVETKDMKVLIDPAVSLGPRRYGLPPHRLELERMDLTWNDIKNYASKCDLLIVTHYHYDHHNPDDIDFYKDKTLYIKDPKNNINKSQLERASHFLKELQGLPKAVEFADGRSFQHAATTIKFSPPVYHGTNSRLGYVLETSISCQGEKMVFSSDVEGPSLVEQADFILRENPDLLILDGPMTYMLGYRYSQESLARSVANITKIISETTVKVLILDHHLLRDQNYKAKLANVYECAEENGVRVLSAAEYVGREPDLLEARRKDLYAGIEI
ncbi:MAG: hypothetical protein GYA39_03275 [Methanothrix sp.]|nr:hypothetical protein [Methanothrix sp.]